MFRGPTRSSSSSRAPQVFLLLLGVCLLPARALATDVQGVLSTHTVWTKRGSPYVLTGDVTVGWGVELVIQPGVRVIAASEDALRSGVDSRRVELIVDGTLVVKGTEARPVELTAQGERGSWYGLRVRGGRGTVIKGALISRALQGLSLDTSAEVRNTSVSDTLRDCVRVSWGRATLVGNQLSGCGENGLSVEVGASARMERTVVTGSGAHGVELHGGGELLNNTLRDNAASGVMLLGETEAPVVRDCLIAANGGHGVYRAGSARGELLDNDVRDNVAGDYGGLALAGRHVSGPTRAPAHALLARASVRGRPVLPASVEGSGRVVARASPIERRQVEEHRMKGPDREQEVSGTRFSRSGPKTARQGRSSGLRNPHEADAGSRARLPGFVRAGPALGWALLRGRVDDGQLLPPGVHGEDAPPGAVRVLPHGRRGRAGGIPRLPRVPPRTGPGQRDLHHGVVPAVALARHAAAGKVSKDANGTFSGAPPESAEGSSEVASLLPCHTTG